MLSPSACATRSAYSWQKAGWKMDAIGESLAERIVLVRGRIAAAAERAGRGPDEVTLVAVTKRISPEVVSAAHTAGLTTFGENRVQEAQSKRAVLDLPGVRWELVGHLQTNKVAAALVSFDRIHSVDNVRLALALESRAGAQGQVMPILLEVNVAGEASKTGFSPAELPDAARAILALSHVQIEGLMTVAPMAANPDDVRPIFARLRGLRDLLRREAPTPLGADGGWRELSMGMTDDFEVAIEEGATLVRIGRAIFGERPPTGV